MKKKSKPGDAYNAFNTRGVMNYSRRTPEQKSQQLANTGFGGTSTIKRTKKRKKKSKKMAKSC